MQDPREYLPFLRELRALDKFYQRFRIDDHLKRREKALKNLHLAGSRLRLHFGVDNNLSDRPAALPGSPPVHRQIYTI